MFPLLLLAAAAVAAEPAAPYAEQFSRLITRKVREITEGPPPRWREIPWVASLTEAERLSRQEQRPLFIFAYAGDLDSGRC
jgi:hypothetical protein